MQQSRIETPYENSRSERLQQGDIFRDVTVVEGVEEEKDAVVAKYRSLTYVVVLSQDCDLEQDFRNRENLDSKTNDKYLQWVLLCPAYIADIFRDGSHLNKLGLTMQSWPGRDDWKRITQNQIYRYHFLEAFPDLQIPELVLDFKHCVTAPRSVLYREECKAGYLGTVSELYRESLSGRFAHYLCRIALPEQTDS